MVFLQALFALAIVVLIGAVLTGLVFRAGPQREGPEPWGLYPMLFLIFLVVWAASLWIVPVGPTILGVAWVPLLFVGLVMALFWASVGASASASRFRPVRPVAGPAEQARSRHQADVREPRAVSIFFWVLLILLAVAILARWL